MNVSGIIRLGITFIICTLINTGHSQENYNINPFKQLKQELATPNSYRTASGAPGHEYWQQRADYKIKMRLDEPNRQLFGEETITYYNQSPDNLRYLWLQLDQNVRDKESDTYKTESSSMRDRMYSKELQNMVNDFEGGFNIEFVKTTAGTTLDYTINKTMMRVNLPEPLQPGEQFSFSIKWWYNINDHTADRARSGYEYFEEDDNDVYVIAQFFPRMCVYNEVEGWQNKQFRKRGEFALSFGDYEVELTVPEDHLVASTGELLNPKEVLSGDQRKRLDQATKEHVQPVIIASLEEAEERAKSKSTKSKTWKFKAKNVRDFAWATSRRFIWDAMGVPMQDGRTVMAQSMYIKEGNCLWNKYSTKAVAHTVKWFSHYTVDYPYPVAWSIDGNMGMEYPMICFNYGRCQADDTYNKRTKYGHIGVIIHEVGHNWFPMIINSDERQWTWMDEGLTTFVQFLTEQHWERNYPSRRGQAHKIVDYMKGDKSRISPIMTNSESIWQFGNNAYGKPATALNILRETIMGRELFDYAFKEYCQRWAFKHPTPADFFRTMEDASGVDLDWFWRGWFFTNDHVDISMEEVNHFKMNSKNPDELAMISEKKKKEDPRNITDIRNDTEIEKTLADVDPSIIDFYSEHKDMEINELDRVDYSRYYNSLSEDERALMEKGYNFYELKFKNQGGLIMPVILELKYKDGSNEIVRIPAEVWRMGTGSVSKVVVREKEIEEIILDPFLETADVDRSDNYYPPRPEISRFEMFKQRRQQRENPMQRAKRAEKLKKDPNRT
jgi:hypothetical protein